MTNTQHAPLPAESEEIDRRAALCITTFLRPTGLTEALEAVARMRIPAGWDLEIVVIDNDAEGSARPIAEAAAAGGLPLRYVVEPKRGLSHVRNRACAEAADRDWLLFLDDDEAPHEDWLERIDATQRAADADVTIGPSVPVFDEQPPAWVETGGFFERERFATGTRIPFWNARTSGVLVRIASYAHLGDEPFDPYLALSSGEDRNFFCAIEDAGGTFVWADDAIVRERVPASRSNLGWIVRRGFRTGNSRSMTLVRLEHGGPWRRFKRIVRGGIDMSMGAGRMIVGPDTARRVRGLQHGAYGLGLALGALGYRYDEYKRTHGA
jgi:glycosyltransferase involved in cell wall biosynthesis